MQLTFNQCTDVATLQAYCLQQWLYDDGMLIWKKNGRPVGTKGGNHYKQIDVREDGQKVGRLRTHRVIFLMHHGEYPEVVDHIDCDKTNNKIENLRAATSAENSRNKRLLARNTSGYKGVSFNKRVNKWLAHIRTDGKLKHLGMFDTAESAHVAYVIAAKECHKEFARQD